MKRLKGPQRPSPPDPEEIVARALCRDDPDADTPRGPLWTGYRKDAKRVLKALGGRVIADGWTPTPAAINALPEPLRRFILDLETRAGDVPPEAAPAPRCGQ